MVYTLYHIMTILTLVDITDVVSIWAFLEELAVGSMISRDQGWTDPLRKTSNDANLSSKASSNVSSPNYSSNVAMRSSWMNSMRPKLSTGMSQKSSSNVAMNLTDWPVKMTTAIMPRVD